MSASSLQRTAKYLQVFPITPQYSKSIRGNCGTIEVIQNTLRTLLDTLGILRFFLNISGTFAG